MHVPVFARLPFNTNIEYRERDLFNIKAKESSFVQVIHFHLFRGNHSPGLSLHDVLELMTLTNDHTGGNK